VSVYVCLYVCVYVVAAAVMPDRSTLRSPVFKGRVRTSRLNFEDDNFNVRYLFLLFLI